MSNDIETIEDIKKSFNMHRVEGRDDKPSWALNRAVTSLIDYVTQLEERIEVLEGLVEEVNETEPRE